MPPLACPGPLYDEGKMVGLWVGLPDQLRCAPEDQGLVGGRPHGDTTEVQHALGSAEIVGVVAAQLHGGMGAAQQLDPVVEPVRRRQSIGPEHHLVQQQSFPVSEPAVKSSRRVVHGCAGGPGSMPRRPGARTPTAACGPAHHGSAWPSDQEVPRASGPRDRDTQDRERGGERGRCSARSRSRSQTCFGRLPRPVEADRAEN